jgi:ATP-dependent DNA ligase
MANETIELLKNYEPAKMTWPALHQQKIDGVPVRVIKQESGIRSYTRQGELVKSISHIERFCSTLLLENGESVVMELHIEGKPFKEISGLVRRKQHCPELRGWFFDCDWKNVTVPTYHNRLIELSRRLTHIINVAGCALDDLAVKLIPGVFCADENAAQAAHEALLLAKPDAEGSVIHSLDKIFNPGKRCWGTQRMKPVPTIDLLVVGFEEAISEAGVPLGMVGRINADFNMIDPLNGSRVLTTVGVGPGALNHTERKELWRMWKKGQYTPRIAEIRYMRDDSYDALRQPTFKCWRDDKDTTDACA